ncbi:sensor histidine kinase [Streptomyces abyssomicinicus]|uniref:sensor histidine kinase n=1 Tax=Streptomyces abyssomicinicus TaxID=574929 RepID=UPI001FE4DAAD|nr:sensor histidine kinase [Streptomyces abyssomicinicus]
MRNDGAGTGEPATAGRGWELFRRCGPHAMLVFTAALAAAAPELTPVPGERRAAAVLVGAAVVVHLGWDRAHLRRPGPSPAGAVYYWLRWALGFALSWLNPLFAFYSAVGYFDAEDLIPRGRRPWRRLGPLACALPVAGAQAGGLPPQSTAQWGLFAGLLIVNLALIGVTTHFSEQQEERSSARAAAIVELERANAALRRALDENAALHTQLLLQAREAGIADERRRLAAEIHDTLAQGLTGIIAQLQVVASTDDPAVARRHADRAADLARHSLGEARRSVQNLAPAGLAEDGLPQALRKTVDGWSERQGLRAEFTLTGEPEQLHGEVAATLLRISQEALSNVARHASASRVGVTLSFMGDEVTLDVRDDGRGFDPAALPPRTRNGGFGLDGMRARAERIAGSVVVESEAGQGTAVSTRVPLVRHER